MKEKKLGQRFIAAIVALVMVLVLVPIGVLAEEEVTVSAETIWNGHKYQIIDETRTWYEAKNECEKLGGHLVTITSAAEEEAIESLLTCGERNYYWIGAERTNDSWTWVTGEPLDYSNWAPGEPNNSNGGEPAAVIYKNDYNSVSVYGTWNDINAYGGGGFFSKTLGGYICEFDNYSVQYEGNSNHYQIFDDGLTWEEAKAKCEKMGGHLATIGSQEEQDFIDELLKEGTRNNYWLGGQRNSNTWSWITGEKWNYTNWAPNMPDNWKDTGEENKLMIYRNSNPTSNNSKLGDWNDLHESGLCGANPHFGLNNFGFICEWDSDKDIPDQVPNYEKFDMDTYMANALVRDRDIYSLDYYESQYQGPSDIIVSGLLDNSSFRHTVTAWEAAQAILTIDLDNAVEREVNIVDYYEAIILSLCKSVLESETYYDLLKGTGLVTTTKNLEKINKLIYNIDTGSVKLDKELSASDKEVFLKQYENEYKGTADMMSAVKSFLTYCDDLNSFYKTLSQYETLNDTTGALTNTLRVIRDNTTDKYVLKALTSVIDSLESQTGKMLVAIEKGTLQVVEWTTDELVSEIVKEFVMTNPILKTLKAAGAVGTAISNFAFGTDKTIEQYYAMQCLKNYQVDIKNAVKAAQTTYIENSSDENAKQYVALLNYLYSSYDLDCDYAKDFLKSIYDTALIGELKLKIDKSFFGKSDTYEDFKETINITKKMLSLQTTSVNKYWAFGLMEDYPDLFEPISEAIQLYKLSDISDVSIRLEGITYPYTGKEIKPKASVFYNDIVLKEGEDYELEYSNNVEVGTAVVKIIGKTKYFPGEATRYFVITSDNPFSWIDEYKNGGIRNEGVPITTPEQNSSNVGFSKNGIVQTDDGRWALFKNGKVDTTMTSIAKNEYGWWRVKNGYVDFNANGIYKNQYGWWKTKNGKVTFKETGIFKNEYGWWRVVNSKVDFKANGIYKNQYGWWKTTGGKVTFKENGVYKNEYGWWKVKNSKVDFDFTGIASNKNGKWYIKNGKVDFAKNGKVKYNGTTYTIKNGKVQ